MTNGDRLSRVQDRAIAALMVTRTIAEAATAAGVGEKTLRRWLGSEPFATEYRAAAREAAREATSALLAAQREAVEVLRACLHDGSAATRTRAARALLDLGVRVAADDIETRLAELEQEVRQWDGTPTPGLRIV